ncbi:hypothetical protein Sjap_002263 [Stephania japonica]|uniref:Uncharacterized protein n=1 Tax=Stephania japonica TaxID=461633 RepID=A0AAP0KLL3_9MAGN
MHAHALSLPFLQRRTRSQEPVGNALESQSGTGSTSKAALHFDSLLTTNFTIKNSLHRREDTKLLVFSFPEFQVLAYIHTENVKDKKSIVHSVNPQITKIIKELTQINRFFQCEVNRPNRVRLNRAEPARLIDGRGLKSLNPSLALASVARERSIYRQQSTYGIVQALSNEQCTRGVVLRERQEEIEKEEAKKVRSWSRPNPQARGEVENS